MGNLFGMQDMAAGYASSRPPLHGKIVERIHAHLKPAQRWNCALDIGCGAGLSTRPLQPLSAMCVGLEPAESMLRWTSTVAPGAQFLVGHAEQLPIRSGSIDIITAAGSLNYADLSLFFPEAARVLAPGAALVVYDFSQGRTFRHSQALDEWFAEFMRRYPRPARLGPPVESGIAGRVAEPLHGHGA